MTILVTGGAGYVGSHTVRAMLEAGYSVVVADNLSTGFRAAVPAACRLYEGDIRDAAFLTEIFEKEEIDGVIHFAAFSQVGESGKVPLRYYENNVGGTRVLLEQMTAHGVDTIVFSSSAAVYGEPEQIPIEETAPLHPTNCYGETKRVMEQMMRWTAAASGLRYAGD